jgi:hypothetical protein
MPIKKSFLKTLIKPWVKKRGKPIMSSVGITRYGNAWLALFVKPYLSLSLTPSTKLFSSVSSLIIISLVSVSFESLPCLFLELIFPPKGMNLPLTPPEVKKALCTR